MGNWRPGLAARPVATGIVNSPCLLTIPANLGGTRPGLLAKHSLNNEASFLRPPIKKCSLKLLLPWIILFLLSFKIILNRYKSLYSYAYI